MLSGLTSAVISIVFPLSAPADAKVSLTACLLSMLLSPWSPVM